MKDELERQSRLHLARFIFPIIQNVQTHETMRSSVVVAWVAAHLPLPLIRQAGAHDLGGRCYDERGQAMSSTRRHWKSMSRGAGAGRTCLMFVVFLRRMMSTLQWSRPEKNVSFSAYMLLLGKFAIVVCCAEVLFQPSFHCLVNTLLAELCHGAYHGTEHCTD